MKSLKGIILYSLSVFGLSIAYYLYARNTLPREESETFLSEIGEGFGEVALWLLLFIYARTLLKLLFEKGALQERILPNYVYEPTQTLVQKILIPLNRTHVYVGVATLAVTFLHIVMVGFHFEIVLFQVVMILLIWQGVFGFFLRWKFSPKQLKKFSYLVHAQFLTGIMIGIFAYVGHWMVD